MSDVTNERLLHDAFLKTLTDAVESADCAAATLGVARQYLKDIGMIAKVAVEVANAPKGPVATGIGRILPFEETEDPDEMVG